MKEPTKPTLPGLTLEEILPGEGHNRPPPYDPAVYDDLKARTAAFMEVSDEWQKTEIANDDLAGQAADQIAGLRSLADEIGATIKHQTAPHDKAIADVKAAFQPLGKQIETAIEALKTQIARYALAKAAAERKRKEEEQRIADAKAEEARRLALDAERSGSLADKAGAAEAQKAADQAARAASKPVSTAIRSASGGGRTMAMRSRRQCSIENINLAFREFRDDPDVAETLIRLANRRANAAGFGDDGTIPGFSIVKVQSLA